MLGVLAVLGSVFSRQIVRIFTLLSHNPAQWDLAVFLNRIIIPAVFFMALAGMAAAMLQQLSACSRCRRRRRYFSIWC